MTIPADNLFARTSCPHCGDDMELSDYGTHYLLDVKRGEGECFVTLHPCCEGMQRDVEWYSYEHAVGRTVQQVVAEVTGQDVLEVVADGDGTVVCRLRTVNPTEVTGERKASSPKGWQAEIFEDVDQHHRHHPRPQGWKFGVAVYNGDVKVGVAVVGRPVSRVLQAQQPLTLEVTRVCTFGHSALRKNAVSKLYAACAEQARALGYRKLITYTIDGVEDGASLQASGWTVTNVSQGGSWACEARPEASTVAPTNAKVRWEKGLCKSEKKGVRRMAIEWTPAAQPVQAPAEACAQAPRSVQVGGTYTSATLARCTRRQLLAIGTEAALAELASR